jgi:hypothetical protein
MHQLGTVDISQYNKILVQINVNIKRIIIQYQKQTLLSQLDEFYMIQSVIQELFNLIILQMKRNGDSMYQILSNTSHVMYWIKSLRNLALKAYPLHCTKHTE